VLYRPEAFEPLTEEPWDEDTVREDIRSIVAETEEVFDGDALWPVTDEWDSFEARTPLTTLYAGASGVVWGLDELRRGDHAETRLDLRAVALRTLERWREAPDFEPRHDPPGHTHASLYLGEAFPLLVAWRFARSSDLADALYARVSENAENEANELMNGSPGTMLVAQAMRSTGEERWAEAWRASADVLLRRRDAEGLWTYAPYGRGLGAAHGVSTNAAILLQGSELLDAGLADDLRQDTARALERTAVVENGRANWPMTAEEYPELVGYDGQIRLQWCHGGAGVVASSAAYLDEELLLAGANLVWDAGPPGMAKGPGICHGTAGNGYAFLKVFERTGDELWLERARRFAVHSLGQAERWRERRGRYRYTLWSGDIGAALFAADCLDARPWVPIVDGIG
jgi:Lanthionine synthetase C-like protein